MRLRDVGRVEMGATNYNLSCTYNMQPSVGLAVFQLPGANALDTADRIREKMDELKAHFPEGVDYAIGHDITPFIRESVKDVVRTLLEAIVLVAIVVLVFLQNWRAALIPLMAVPVAIIGTFAVMLPLGFSLNNISLFGLVLAIGIVVDDAIVVVENVERWLEQGLSPREAARKAMDEVTGPVIAVALVLCAVFVPCAFISGITGQFFRQFADHDRRVDGDLGRQFADAESGAGSDPAEAAAGPSRRAGPAAELDAGLVLPAVQPGLRVQHEPLHADRRRTAACQPVVLRGLRRVVGADILADGAHPAGLHSAAGPGLAARQRAIARFGQLRRTQEVMDRVERLRAYRSRRGAHRLRVGLVVLAECEQLELRLDVRDS